MMRQNSLLVQAASCLKISDDGHHYLGEILSFVGYAIMSDLLPVWGNATVLTAYLSARAHSTLNWYRREMPLQIPSGWRRLVPFAY